MARLGAAEWTLQYQFGVRVTSASQPLAKEVVDAIVPVMGEASSSRTQSDDENETRGGASFDSVPGVGLITNAVAAGILPPKGNMTGSGGTYSA